MNIFISAGVISLLDEPEPQLKVSQIFFHLLDLLSEIIFIVTCTRQLMSIEYYEFGFWLSFYQENESFIKFFWCRIFGLIQGCQLLKMEMREISLIEKCQWGRFTVASFFVTFLQHALIFLIMTDTYL